MSADPVQTRWDFPHPTVKERSLMFRICHLMMDGVARSKEEICDALNLPRGTEIGARIRDAKRAAGGAWPFREYTFSDSRSAGPQEDGIYRWRLVKRGEQ